MRAIPCHERSIVYSVMLSTLPADAKVLGVWGEMVWLSCLAQQGNDVLQALLSPLQRYTHHPQGDEVSPQRSAAWLA